ncbi:hypothetical protein DRQ20_05475 [bacterium]|nr:MAG: hypothetical protein DRQ20_05475 [bacterium]
MIFLLSFLYWEAMRSKHFTVFYPPELWKEAERTISYLEYYKSLVDSLTGNSPRHVPVVIEDMGILSNGFASAINPQVHLFSHPPSPFILTSTPDWWKLVSVHEYTHISHLTHTRGLPLIMKFLWGDLFQPNIYSPGWIVEGITVYAESRLSPYGGRLNDGYLDAVVLAQAKENKLTSPVRATSDGVDFPLERAYFYGGSFMRWISEVYGENSFSQFFKNYASNPLVPGIGNLIPILGIDLASLFTYHHTLDVLYNKWRREMRLRAEKEKFPEKKLTSGGMYRELLSSSPSGICYVKRSYDKGGVFDRRCITEIVLFNPQSKRERVLARTTSWVISRPIIREDKIYWLEVDLKNGYKNRALMGFGAEGVLVEKEIEGKERVITRGPYVSFTFLGDTLFLATRHAVYRYGEEIPVFEGGLEIGEIRGTEKGILMVAKEKGKNWDIYLLKKGKPVLLVSSPYPDVDPCFYGESLYFSSTDGRYNIYCLTPHGEIEKITDYVYARDPVVLDGKLYFLSPTGDGIHLFSTFPELKEKIEFEKMEPESVPHAKFTRTSPFLNNILSLSPCIRIFLPLPDTSGMLHPLILLAGADVLLTQGYAIFVGPDTLKGENAWMITYQNHLLAPLILKFTGFRLSGNTGFHANLLYPLKISMRKGLSSVWMGLSFVTPDTVTLFQTLSWNYPFAEFGLYPSYSISFKEKKGRGMAYFEGRKWLGEFKLFLRGWVAEKRRWNVRAGFSIPLPVKFGLWNPNIYFENAFLTLYAEAQGENRNTTSRCVGIRLSIETKLFFGIFGFPPGIEYVWKNGTWQWRPAFEGDE